MLIQLSPRLVRHLAFQNFDVSLKRPHNSVLRKLTAGEVLLHFHGWNGRCRALQILTEFTKTFALVDIAKIF